MIDNYIPQLYRQTLPDYTATLNSAVSYVPSSKKSITFAGVLAKAGTYTVTPDLLVNMVKANRGAGINGESYFFYEAFPLNNNKLADTLRNSVYKENALLPYRNGNVYRPKPKMILETDNANVVKNGSWTQNVIAAFDSVSYMAESTAPASITYFDTFTYAAWFDVYTYAVPNFSFTKNARFTLYGDMDSSVVVINQQDTKNSGWIKLGSVYLNPGRKRFLKIDNGLVEPGKLLFADASFCMINRKKSPDVIITTTERIAVIIPNAPERDSLFYSYPNPFNQQTVIRFSIAEPSHVSLIVYDILGKTVELLLDQILEAGYYERYYRPDNLASGMYICRFKTKHETRSVKMLMLK
ncbi:MAG: T9SS type A sorting domain-containing protein [Ignavibacteriales bacterium]|nr:T9SS type A sorting domain-containing protein [Ignavibacteriales bacterium]